MKILNDLNIGKQLFSSRIDEELNEILRQQALAAAEMFSFGNNAWISNYFKPEFDSLIFLIFYGMSIGCMSPTPGMRTLSLRLPHTADTVPEHKNNASSMIMSMISNSIFGRIKKRFLCLVVLYWSYLRLKHVSIAEGKALRAIFNTRKNAIYVMTVGWRSHGDDTIKKRLWRLLQVAEFCFKISSVSNTLAFLFTGSYPLLIHRLMGFRMVSFESLDLIVIIHTDMVIIEFSLQCSWHLRMRREQTMQFIPWQLIDLDYLAGKSSA
jgi:hypothetical protein